MASPPLRLEESFVTHLEIRANSTPEPHEGDEEILTDVALSRNPDDNTVWVVGLRLHSAREAGPYYVNLECRGVFKIIDPMRTVMESAQMVAIQGTSILYSGMREHIAMVTGRFPWGPFRLPTTSFYDLVLYPDNEESGKLLLLLRIGPRSVAQLALELGIEQPATKALLKDLEERQLVVRRKKGKQMVYDLRPMDSTSENAPAEAAVIEPTS